MRNGLVVHRVSSRDGEGERDREREREWCVPRAVGKRERKKGEKTDYKKDDSDKTIITVPDTHNFTLLIYTRVSMQKETVNYPCIS